MRSRPERDCRRARCMRQGGLIPGTLTLKGILLLGVECMDLPSAVYACRFSWTYRTLLALLSDIASPHLQQLSINFDQFYYLNAWLVGELSEDATVTFHACLTRDVFAGLGKRSVSITYGFGDQRECSAAPRTLFVRLFAPWLARDVVEILLPDNSRIDAIPEGLPAESP